MASTIHSDCMKKDGDWSVLLRTCQVPDFIYKAANLEVFHIKQAKLGLKLLGYSVVIFFADIHLEVLTLFLFYFAERLEGRLQWSF